MAWGVEIAAERIRVCRATAGRGRVRVRARWEVALPPGAIQPSVKEPNLKDVAAVRDSLQQVCRQAGCRGWVGAALPDAAFSLRSLLTEAVPTARADARRFLAWQARDLLPFPAEETRLDFLPPLPGPNGRLRVVCLMARERVVREYESLLEEAGLAAAVLDAHTPSLARAWAGAGDDRLTGLLSLGDERSTFLVLEGRRPRFWRILPFGRGDWTGGGRSQALRELADSLAYCEESEGIGRVAGVVLEGCGALCRDLPGLLQEWLDLPITAMQLLPEADELDDWGAAIGAAIRPW